MCGKVGPSIDSILSVGRSGKGEGGVIAIKVEGPDFHRRNSRCRVKIQRRECAVEKVGNFGFGEDSRVDREVVERSEKPTIWFGVHVEGSQIRLEIPWDFGDAGGIAGLGKDAIDVDFEFNARGECGCNEKPAIILRNINEDEGV